MLGGIEEIESWRYLACTRMSNIHTESELNFQPWLFANVECPECLNIQPTLAVSEKEGGTSFFILVKSEDRLRHEAKSISFSPRRSQNCG